MKESDIEAFLHARIKALGGVYRRMRWIGRKHAPDDFVMLPGRHCMIECKRPGEVAEPGQAREHEAIRASGCAVHVVSSYADIDSIFPLLKPEL